MGKGRSLRGRTSEYEEEPMGLIAMIYMIVFLAIVVFAVRQWRSYNDFHMRHDRRLLRRLM